MAIKSKERYVRRALSKEGYTLHKSRKPIGIDNFGQYMVIDCRTNAVILGSRYDYSLNDILDWLK